MNITRLIRTLTAGGMLALFPTLSTLHAGPPDSSAMHLSGKLNQAGSPAAGEHEFRFRLFTSGTGDTIVPKTQTIVTSENVTAGNWQTALDLRRFGGEKSLLDDTVIPANEAVSLLDNTVTPAVGERALLDNTVRTAMQQTWRAIEGNWLEISVRRKGSTTFVPLLPRQKLGSVPRASTAFSAEHAAVAGSVTEGGVDNRSIAPGAITADKLAPVSISTGALQDLGVTGSKIAPAAITADKLAPVSIGTGALQDLGVTGAKIAPQTVVRSLNGLRDDVTLTAGQGIALGGQGSVITITATGGGGTPALPHGNALGGGLDNTFGGSAYYGFLGGGEHNKISDANYDSFLGGGKLNVIYERSGSSTLAGGEFNTISTDSPSSVIGGGSGNTVAGELATVLSGQNNTASAYSTVAGGVLNKTENSYATVPGGFQNRASGVASFAAGYNARALHPGAFVWSGFGGNGPFSSARDGEFAVSAPGGVRFTTGGRGFTVDGVSVTAGGGGGNGWSQAGNAGTDPVTAFLGTTDAQPLNFRVNNSPALRLEQRTDANPLETSTGMNVIFNPGVNSVNPPTLAGVMVGGGGTSGGQSFGNEVGSSFSTISGGRLNHAGAPGDSSSTDAFVGGGFGNNAQGRLAVIGGGNLNYAGNYDSILGGVANAIDAPGGVIGAGNLNRITETRSEWINTAHHAGILGGQRNFISNSIYSFIGGGQSNRIQQAADGAVINGGRNNETWGADSVIPGGRNNYAQGTASFAAGTEARAVHAGAFVWNDAGGGTFASLRDNEFAVRARGGIRLDTGGQGLLVDGVPVVGGSGGGNGGGTGPLTVITAGGQTQPQARLEQTNPDDYVRLMMNTPRSFWTVGTGPNGWFSFYVPGQSPANTTGDNGAHRFVITANGEVGVGSQQPLAQFHVRGHGGFDLPQARFTQENPQDFARLRLETGPKAWDIAAAPDDSLRFFGAGSDRLVLGADRVQITTGAGGLTVNGRTVAFADQLGQGGGAGGWALTGNAGTLPARNFLGTTDSQPLEFRVNNKRALRLEVGGNNSVNVIGGYAGNTIAPGVAGATIGGGGVGDYFGFAYTNLVEANFATISGGMDNTIQASAEASTIGGGVANMIHTNAAGSTIGGGAYHTIQTSVIEATIGGGYANNIETQADYATIGGGNGNRIQSSAYGSTIAGGGGIIIETNAYQATIGGGSNNRIGNSASSATISGGSGNRITGQYAMIPGGAQNTATSFAFAAGLQAKAVHTGAFVWADSQGADFPSTANDQFAVRAGGGAVIQGGGDFSHPQLQLTQTGNDFARLRLKTPASSWDLAAGTDGSLRFFRAGSDRMVLAAGGLTVNGTFVSSSDRNVKENFKDISAKEILAKVAALPISNWNYKQDQSARHIGPMAQDFYAAFNVGPDDKHIATVDADGVALAAIQGLHQEGLEKDERIRELEQQVRRLDEIVRKLAAHQP